MLKTYNIHKANPHDRSRHMATIVEKEVALEAVIETLALVQRKIEADRNKGFPEVEEKLLDTREHLYFTDHKDIDSDAIINMCEKIRKEYEHVPDKSIIWNPDET